MTKPRQPTAGLFCAYCDEEVPPTHVCPDLTEAAAPDPVATPAPLDAERLAQAERAIRRRLRASDPDSALFMDRVEDHAHELAAEYARLTSSPDPAALADRLVEEGRVSVWGRPGTKFTAKRAKAPDPEATP